MGEWWDSNMLLNEINQLESCSCLVAFSSTSMITIPSSFYQKASSHLNLDTILNPGNNRDPLLESKGNLIGIDATIFTKTGKGRSLAKTSSP